MLNHVDWSYMTASKEEETVFSLALYAGILVFTAIFQSDVCNLNLEIHRLVGVLIVDILYIIAK